ncbi:MAG: DUF1800 domain-containing protein [Candidatus Kapabacteria bacterium]|nr:DUF1800 domain-containing protein [Candidatus Kapabacteria bacterium]
MNRRSFLRSGAPLPFAPALNTPSAGSLPGSVSAAAGGDPLAPFSPTAATPWDYASAAHLLRRCIIGVAEWEVRRAVSEGLSATLDRLMRRTPPPTSDISDFAGKEPNTAPPPEGPDYNVWLWKKLEYRDRLAMWWLHVIGTSPTSLQERMTLFWHTHIPSQMGKVEFAEFMFVQNMTLRNGALGSVKDLIRAMTKDVGMLIFLDGSANNRYRLNANYARELMELFTMGRVDRFGQPNYTETDVREAARALTGWTTLVNPNDSHFHSTSSIFIRDNWDPGEKLFLGKRGPWNADDVIDIIFTERAEQVAWFICQKFYTTFVRCQPDTRVIEAMAALLQQHDWQAEPVLRALFSSQHFYLPENRGATYKTHVGFYLGLIRTMGLRYVPDFDATTRSPFNNLARRLLGIGELPFYPPDVQGWPQGRAWITSSTLAQREEFAVQIARNNARHSPPLSQLARLYTFDAVEFARTFPQPEDPHALCDDILQLFLAAPISTAEREALHQILLDGGKDYEWKLDDPAQRADERIRKLLEAVFKMPQFHLC